MLFIFKIYILLPKIWLLVLLYNVRPYWYLMSFHIFSRQIFVITIFISFYLLFLFLVFKASQWHVQIEPNYCVKHFKIFKKSKCEKTFWNDWHENHPKWQYREKISKCKDCQINSWQRNSERSNDINEKLKRIK